MMWNKHFGSMYSGSMIGSGAIVFAVWGYVIASQVADPEVGAQVELNPKLLSFILGEKDGDVAKAIEFLCQPDPKIRTPDNDGRRLVKLGEYAYQVVNGEKYAKLRNEDDRRRQNREAKRRERAKPKGKSVPLPGETAYVKTLENEGQAAADAQMERGEALDGLVGELVQPENGWTAIDGLLDAVAAQKAVETPGQRAEREYLESLGLKQ